MTARRAGITLESKSPPTVDRITNHMGLSHTFALCCYSCLAANSRKPSRNAPKAIKFGADDHCRWELYPEASIVMGDP